MHDVPQAVAPSVVFAESVRVPEECGLPPHRTDFSEPFGDGTPSLLCSDRGVVVEV